MDDPEVKTEIIDLNDHIVLNPLYEEPPNFTVLGATTIPLKFSCYGCSRDFFTIEQLHAHICPKQPKTERNGMNSNPSTSTSASTSSSYMRNGLLNNNPGEPAMYPMGLPKFYPGTISRPRLQEYRSQTEPTDLTTRMEDNGATSSKRRRMGGEMIPSSYACGDTSETVEAYTSHCFDHYIVQASGYCCSICRILFRTEEESMNHYQEHHAITLYRCVVCGDLMENNMALQLHYASYHRIFCTHSSCKLCPNLVFQDRLAVQFHISMVHFKQCFRNQNSNEQEQSYTPENNIYHQSPQSLPATSSNPQPLNQQSSSSSSVLYPKLEPGESIYARTTPKSLTCDICNLTEISSEAELISHKKLQHSKSKTRSLSLQCAYCKEKNFKSRSDLENHMKSHQVVHGKSKHKCNICDAIFPSSVTLAEHKLTHCKIIEGSICVQCKGGLKEEKSYYQHQRLHSTNPTTTKYAIGFPANCVICCQTLQNSIELNFHASFHLKHLLRKPICTLCNETFDAPPKHNGEQNQLSVCPKCTTEGDPRVKRETDSTDSAAIIPRYNPETNRSVSENEKNNLECRSCKQVFPSPGKLQTHLIEHNFVGMNQYNCYICSSVFTGAEGLRNHILGHGSQNKPYECPHCELKYFFRTELENHIVIHDASSSNANFNNITNERSPLLEMKESDKYGCIYCRNVFSKESYYLEHMKNCSVKFKMEDSQNANTDNKIKQEIVDSSESSDTE